MGVRAPSRGNFFHLPDIYANFPQQVSKGLSISFERINNQMHEFALYSLYAQERHEYVQINL
jgi:hypothetical protein